MGFAVSGVRNVLMLLLLLRVGKSGIAFWR